MGEGGGLCWVGGGHEKKILKTFIYKNHEIINQNLFIYVIK
jgi:hypothetical protein